MRFAPIIIQQFFGRMRFAPTVPHHPSYGRIAFAPFQIYIPTFSFLSLMFFIFKCSTCSLAQLQSFYIIVLQYHSALCVLFGIVVYYKYRDVVKFWFNYTLLFVFYFIIMQFILLQQQHQFYNRPIILYNYFFYRNIPYLISLSTNMYFICCLMACI